MSTWTLRCPECNRDGLLPGNADLRCEGCGRRYPRQTGVCDLLRPGRAAFFQPFLNDYTTIRRAEGRGYQQALCRELPCCRPDHPLAKQWRIRASSYQSLRRLLTQDGKSGLKILDLGGGCGWLSHRLRELTHMPCTVDISDDDVDGLRGARAFAPDWPLLRAEFEHLPLAGDQADNAIFNASFHYAIDAKATLAEAMRVLRPDGRLIIMDTPIYRSAASGERMQQEQHAGFERRFGLRSDRLPVIGFLTWDILERLGQDFGLDWRAVKPWYGWRWSLRPLFAKLHGTREPAQFALLVGTRTCVGGG